MTANPNRPEAPVGALQLALADAERLLGSEPALAAEQAAEILKSVPGHPAAELLLGAARRRINDLKGALALLQPLARSQPGSLAVHYELGLALGALGRGDEAVAALRKVVELKPDFGDAWRALADHLSALGDTEGADGAFARQLKFASRDPRLLEAGAALVDKRCAQAEQLLRAHLKQQPTDVAAIRILAEVVARLGRLGDSEVLLARCLELAPAFTAARYDYAAALNRQGKEAQALAEVEQVLAQEPDNPSYRNLLATILGRIGEHGRAIATYEGVLAQYPQHPRAWMSYGHALKSAGRHEDAIAAYRRAIELKPGLGESWWSLANVRTFRFGPEDIPAMQAELARAELGQADRYHFHFAIGKAFEDQGSWADAFSHYEQGNRLRRALFHYDAEENTNQVYRSKSLFSKAFFEERSGFGAAAPDPIFIVGLPHSGSTLIEQVLSSHSAVERTTELPDVISIARVLGERKARSGESRYPEVLATLGAAEFRDLGERFIEQARIQRRSGAPFFIDRMPSNFAHIGLIHLMLPKAKIIDARRHPVGCCFSAFRQHFARGQPFSYSLDELGRYYRDYVELMAHFDAALPGRIHRVIYEHMIENPDAEIRGLLDYCGLPFEPDCLRLHDYRRAAQTTGSEQSRQPAYREAVDHWRHFESWLGPLQNALGPVLDAYPAAPAF